MKNDNPLVSIIVITYNSSDFVLETLESLKNQTYKNIELVVSDDCSKDNTAAIAKNWIDINKDRFSGVQLIESPVNTGISANCNRGCKASRGRYLKTLAGDDTLEADAIQELVNYCSANSTVSLVFGQVILMNEHSERLELVDLKIDNKLLTFDKQFQANLIHAPATFFSRSIYDKVNGFDENLKIEDIDFYLKILYNGGIIRYIQHPIANYRMHSTNISKNNYLMLQEHIKTLDKYKGQKNYKNNYRKFAKNVLYTQKTRQGEFDFFKLYNTLSNTHSFVYFIFFDLRFWAKFFFKRPVKNLLKSIGMIK